MTSDNTRPATKRCSRCQETLPIDQFGRDPARKDGLKTRCRRCRNAVERESARRRRHGLPQPPRGPETPVGPRVCVSCDEGEHDTCLRILRPGACVCTCPTEPSLKLPPIPSTTFLVCGMDLTRKMVRAAAPPWPEADYCHSGHLVEGANAYWDQWQRRWLCRRCRQASWRRSEVKKRAANVAANARAYKARPEAYVAERTADGTEDGIPRPSIYDE